MIVFHSHCQMGNQMFIYACARSLAKKRKLNYCLSDLKGLHYFELSSDDKNNNFKYNKFRILSKLPGFQYKFFHLQDNRYDYLQKITSESYKNVWYYGYFQGERYFQDIQDDIRECFKIKSSFHEKYRKALSEISSEKEFITVHIRLSDYKTFGPDFLQGPDLSLPFDYYHKLIQEYYHNEKNQLVFLSDDIALVKQVFQSQYPEAYFSENTPIVDFQILMNSQIALISHSSFAWWASWLNTKKDKKIIVPEYFLGFKVEKEFPIGMIPPGWIQKNVKKYLPLC